MRIPKVVPPGKIRHPYSRRILSNLRGKDPLRVFASGPSALRRAVLGLSAAQMRRRPGPGKWSVAYLVHHVCDAEIALAFRIRLALAQSGTKFQAYDQDLWAAALRYDRRSVAESIALYTALRRSHLELLRLMTGRDLRKYGRHEERGKETVERLIHLLAGHDINHVRQIMAIRAQFRKR